MTNNYYLTAQFDSRQSFYNKALVKINNRGSVVLQSYNTDVVKIVNGRAKIICDFDDLTQTTLRHIREFLKQQGFEVGTKAELVEMYMD